VIRYAIIFLLLIHPAVYAVDLMIDVDAFDNLSSPGIYKANYYGADQIHEFFQKCRSSGVSMVTWRSQCQIASYPSKLNYSFADEPNIRSQPELQQHTGAFALKIGVKNSGNGLIQETELLAAVQWYTLSAWVMPLTKEGVYLCVLLPNGNKINSKCAFGQSDAWQRLVLEFEAADKIKTAIVSTGSPEIARFIVDDVSLKSQTGTEFIKNGGFEEFSMLEATHWDSSGCNFVVLCGDIKAMSPTYRKRLLPNADGYIHVLEYSRSSPDHRIEALKKYDPLKTAVRAAKENKVKIYAWFDPLDDGRRVIPGSASQWVSRFMEENPEYLLCNSQGRRRWGQFCFGYKAVRDYKTAVVRELLDYDVDGIYLKLSFQHNFVWDGGSYDYGSYVYNDIALKEYERQFGRPENGEYDIKKLKVIQSEFFEQWIKDVAEVIHSRGKRLLLSMYPSDYSEKTTGAWPFDWKALIQNHIVDEFMIEPRHSGDPNGLMRDIEQRMHYAQLCSKNDVKYGFDYYATALVNSAKKLNKPAQILLEQQVNSIAESPVDFIGIYEGLNVDVGNYWPYLRSLHDSISNRKIDKEQWFRMAQPIESKSDSIKVLKLTAQKIGGDAIVDCSQLCDGDISDAGAITFLPASPVGMPFVLMAELEGVHAIKRIRIHSGIVNWMYNPSGLCNIKTYKLQVRSSGKWQDVNEFKTIPAAVNTGLTPYNCFEEINFKIPVSTNAVRIEVVDSYDTGKRNRCPDKPCIAENERAVCIREVEFFKSDLNSSNRK